MKPSTDIDQLDPREYIIVKGAKVNNLKDLSVAIPRNKMVVVTGVSGSGKSSLAFDTLFAEGQRMYVESLSSYARQFLGRMEKPEVEYIKGISPAIAVEQKVTTKNPRSTVGTTTEVYDYLKLLFARIGKTYSPVSGEEVSKDSVTSVVNQIMEWDEGTRFMILCPLILKDGRTLEQELKLLLQKGYSRVEKDGEVFLLEELLEGKLPKGAEGFNILLDRNVVKKGDEDAQYRIADSVQTAFFEGEGDCLVHWFDADRQVHKLTFSDRFERDGMTFEEPSVNLFSFNNPYGACKTCDGFGSVLGIDPDLIIPNKDLSFFEGAVAPWQSEAFKAWHNQWIEETYHINFPLHRPYKDLTPDQQEMIWKGTGNALGINAFIKELEAKTYKIQYRVMLARYRGKTQCPDCKGTRVRKDAGYVKIHGHSIMDMVLMPVKDLHKLFEELTLTDHEMQVGKRLLTEIRYRLSYLHRVGLGYLTLNRLTSTLSGGEYQRIKLATSLGSALVGSMYILDEPSIGLHPRDTRNLVSVLRDLQKIGNTVLVVEHEEEMMRAADQIIDIGPDAGAHGGELVFQGTMEELAKSNTTYTSRYLNNIDRIEVPSFRRRWNKAIKVIGARQHNLQNVNVDFPLECLVAVTGVSGSGKSTLVRQVLEPGLSRLLGAGKGTVGKHDRIDGDIHGVERVEFVDQNPIGKSSRSNPVTYVKAYDAIRQLYAEQQRAKQLSLTPGSFSFNVEGGRCENCQGEGVVKVEMQFMADIYLTCEVCKGQRFKQEVLEVTYQDKNIAEVLDMTVDEGIEFFAKKKKIAERLQPLQDVGLGYIKLGQSSNTLSGGEAQRVKLASYLTKGILKESEKLLFIFDEPTTGLHFHDISKLLKSINALVDRGHSVIVIEHNMEVIKCADWIIDLGPDGGDGGGQVCFEGTPEEMVKLDGNFTADFLKEKV